MKRVEHLIQILPATPLMGTSLLEVDQQRLGEKPRDASGLIFEQVFENPKLVILEDVDELISIESKTLYTQAVSRLFNIGDGLIGQVTDSYLLLTANNDLDKLQAAVTRPGRCRALFDFRTFSKVESAEWLAAHGRTSIPSNGGHSLAELYQMP